jgi:hypothetical protein
MTTPDPIDQLRDLAAQALRDRVRFYTPLLHHLPPEQQEVWRGHVDAMLAPFLAAPQDKLRYVAVRVEDSEGLSEALGVEPGSSTWQQLLERAHGMRVEIAAWDRLMVRETAERDALRARVVELEGALTHILELIEYQDRPVAQIKVRARMALAAEEGDKS